MNKRTHTVVSSFTAMFGLLIGLTAPAWAAAVPQLQFQINQLWYTIALPATIPTGVTLQLQPPNQLVSGLPVALPAVSFVVNPTTEVGTIISTTSTTPSTSANSASIASVSASNGQVVIQFQQPLVSVPLLTDFTIQQSINGTTSSPLVPTGMTLNTAKTQVTFTVPLVSATSVNQQVIDMVSYQGATTASSVFTVPALLPAAIQVSTPSTLVAGSGATTPLAATVVSASGQGIPGVTVYWTSSQPSVGSVIGSSVTNSNGVATATLTVGTIAGTSQLTASAGGVTSSPISFTATTAISTGLVSSPSTVVNLYQPNTDVSDAADWQRASTNLYLQAFTYDPLAAASGPSLLSVTPGQSLPLIVYAPTTNVIRSQVTWAVNSPDATIIPGQTGITLNNYQVTEAYFTATQPGIYTIQADDNGTYSVPLVLTVGLSQLQDQPFSVTASKMGIEPLPTTLPAETSITQAGVTYAPYPAQGNWIPVSGSTTTGVANMNVVLDGTSGQEWSYRLPVTNGQFSGMVEAPFTGPVTVTLFPHYFQTMTQATDAGTGYSYPTSAYGVTVNGMALSTQDQAILASAHRDYNLSPQFSTVASTLLENSPTLETAMAAIANEASDSITYNQNELQTVNYVWQDVLTAWNTHTGVCEDFSSLAAAMMESVGIPTQTVGGWADQYWTTPPATDTNPSDAHQWDQAWNGSQWVVFDPTWNTNDQSSVPNSLTNEFFTNTTSLAATHLAETNQTGTDFTPRLASSFHQRIRSEARQDGKEAIV